MNSQSWQAWQSAAELPDREDDDDRSYLRCDYCGAFISFKNAVTVTYPDEPYDFERDDEGTVYRIPGRPGETVDQVPCKRCGRVGWEERR